MTPNSSDSPKCLRAQRIEIGQSRVAGVIVAALALAQPVAWGMSAAPTVLAWLASAMGMAYGLGVARRLHRAPCLELALRAGGGAWVNGASIQAFGVESRGPLLVLSGRRAGQAWRTVVFPDAMTAADARALRVWALDHRDRTEPAAVAP